MSDEKLRTAKDVIFTLTMGTCGHAQGEPPCDDCAEYEVKAYGDQRAREEREACAQLVDQHTQSDGLGNAIRAREKNNE